MRGIRVESDAPHGSGALPEGIGGPYGSGGSVRSRAALRGELGPAWSAAFVDLAVESGALPLERRLDPVEDEAKAELEPLVE